MIEDLSYNRKSKEILPHEYFIYFGQKVNLQVVMMPLSMEPDNDIHTTQCTSWNKQHVLFEYTLKLGHNLGLSAPGSIFKNFKQNTN